MKLLGKDWSYISEGNAHIVVQLKGTEFVLRLIKENPSDLKLTDQDSVYNSVNFVNFIVTPLLWEDSKCFQEVITIPPDELKQLDQDLLPFRPENRRNKSQISKFAIKTTNLTILSPDCTTNYCIEIKPKEGFIAEKFKPLSKCYYCLKQKLKLSKGDIEKQSYYCPLDLFSADKNRMVSALFNLVSCPQNNFKIFENGTVFHQGGTSPKDFKYLDFILKMGIFDTVDECFQFLIKILLDDHGLEKQSFNIATRVQDVCIERSNLSDRKYTNCILFKLLNIQKLSEDMKVDRKDIDEENLDYVKMLLDQRESQKLDLFDEKKRGDFVKSLSPLCVSLLSAVAKDCSIMICFSPTIVEGFSHIQVGNRQISYRLALTDLEPKKPKSLIRRQETETRLLNIYNDKS